MLFNFVPNEEDTLNVWFLFCLAAKSLLLNRQYGIVWGVYKIASIRQKVIADRDRLTRWVCRHAVHLRGKGVGKGRHPLNGILGETITFIPGCGNGQLEEVRGQLFRNSFKYFACFWGRIKCWGRNVSQFRFFVAPYYLGLTSLWLCFLTCKIGASGKSLLSFWGVGWQRLCSHKHVVFNLVWLFHPSYLEGEELRRFHEIDLEVAHTAYTHPPLAPSHHRAKSLCKGRLQNGD